MIEVRQCLYCGELYPLTGVWFRPNRQRLSLKCRPCIRADYLRYHQANKVERNAAARAYRKSAKGKAWKALQKAGGETKRCNQCQTVYPATREYFYRRYDRLRGKCKACTDAQVKTYTEANKHWLYPYQKDWKARNKKRVATRRRQYYRRHKATELERRRAYGKANRASARITERNYRLRRKIARFQAASALVRTGIEG
jgi:hypothetical protein